MADIIKKTDDTYRVEDEGVRFYIFCGKCKVRVLNGELKISTMDRIQLTEDGLSLGMRLACRAMPEQTIKIEI